MVHLGAFCTSVMSEILSWLFSLSPGKQHIQQCD